MSTVKENDFAIPNILNIFKNQNLLSVIIAVVLSVMSYYIGALSTELKFYRQGGTPNLAQQAASAGNNAAAPQPTVPTNLEKPTDIDHKRGSITPKLALIEYSDFDCPYCASFHPTAQQAVNEYPELVWIYRHLPLSIHPNAMEKAIASECVFKLGNDEAFWKFADILFERKPELTGLAAIVSSELGISEQDFTSCVDNQDTSGRVKTDMDSASAAGVTGTPGNFIINLETGDIVPISGAQPYEVVKQAIESLL